MPLTYILILSLVFSFSNWTCAVVLLVRGLPVQALMHLINAVPWTVVLACILWAGHQRAKR